MFRSMTEKRLKYLAANSAQSEPRATGATIKSGVATYASSPHRFPPVDDVFAALDRIVSGAIAA